MSIQSWSFLDRGGRMLISWDFTLLVGSVVYDIVRSLGRRLYIPYPFFAGFSTVQYRTVLVWCNQEFSSVYFFRSYTPYFSLSYIVPYCTVRTVPYRTVVSVPQLGHANLPVVFWPRPFVHNGIWSMDQNSFELWR